MLSNFLQRLISTTSSTEVIQLFTESLTTINKNQQSVESKFWHGKRDYLLFEVSTLPTTESILSDKSKNLLDLSVQLDYQERRVHIKTLEKTRIETNKYTNQLREFLVVNEYPDSPLANALRKVRIYDFAPVYLSSKASLTNDMD